jgi:hypothetical protein
LSSAADEAVSVVDAAGAHNYGELRRAVAGRVAALCEAALGWPRAEAESSRWMRSAGSWAIRVVRPRAQAMRLRCGCPGTGSVANFGGDRGLYAPGGQTIQMLVRMGTATTQYPVTMRRDANALVHTP